MLLGTSREVIKTTPLFVFFIFIFIFFVVAHRLIAELFA